MGGQGWHLDFIRTDPENYPEELREWLASVEPRHAWFRVRAELIARCVAARADLDGWLDLGCGTGFVLKAVARRYGGPCFGQDVSLRALRIARRQCNATLLCGEPGSLPLSGLSAVGLLDVIEHLEDDVAALRAAAGYVKPGGLVIVTVPAHPWLWSSVDVASGHQRRYRRRQLISAFRSAGLAVECCQPFFFSLVPVLAARRLASERDASTTLTTSLRPPPPWLDRVMEAVLAFDASLGRRRLLPTGTSWLAVGCTGPSEKNADGV